MKNGKMFLYLFVAVILVTVTSLTVYARATRSATALSIPHTFTAGTIASASEVNDNFDYLADAIDNLEIAWQWDESVVKEVIVGAGQTGQFDTYNCAAGTITISCSYFVPDTDVYDHWKVVGARAYVDHCVFRLHNPDSVSHTMQINAVCAEATVQ